jgi:putative nucleotidyltransferase with HDIG domain
MHESSRLFSNKLDRASLSAYFLGAIVPLLGFAIVVEKFVLPQTERDELLSWIGLIVFTALLSLGSFLVLRNRTQRSLRKIETDNRRLSALLRVASELAAIEHVNAAIETTVRSAGALADSRTTFLFLDDDATPGELSLAAKFGDDKQHEALESELLSLARLALENERPVVRHHGGILDEALSGLSAIAVPVPGEPSPLGALVTLAEESSEEESAARVDALSTLAALASVALHNGDLRDAQRNFFSHVTDILVKALDMHLGFHHGHGNRVAALANRMGRLLELDDTAMQRLYFAALLHDIGMLKLDRNQQMNRSTCDRHSLLGARMLGRIRLWKDIAPAVEHHHEWFDGSGYPGGLAGDDIPLEARVISICDAYDTMTSQDSYKEARMPSEAMSELETFAGTQFDPELVACFRRAMEEGAPALAPADENEATPDADATSTPTPTPIEDTPEPAEPDSEI